MVGDGRHWPAEGRPSTQWRRLSAAVAQLRRDMVDHRQQPADVPAVDKMDTFTVVESVGSWRCAWWSWLIVCFRTQNLSYAAQRDAAAVVRLSLRPTVRLPVS